jgi:hypothetical protein
MAKSLNDILKVAHDRIKGVHASTTSDLSTGKDPGVDYAPRAQGGQDFIAQHSVQKWDEPEGNPNYADKIGYVLKKPEEKRHGYTEPKAKKVNESKKAEDTKCNKTPGQTWCPLHEMADCSKSTTIKEDSEYGMARNELATASRAIDRLNAKMGKGEGELEAWVQAKITKASDYLDTVADYMESGTIKEAYDDNSTKVSDWSDKKLKWHASDDRKHSSSHVPAWSELRRRAKTSAPAPKKTNEEVEPVDEVSSALLYRAKQSAQKKAGWLMPGDGGKGDKAWNRVKKFRDAGVAKEKQEKAVKEEAVNEISDKLALSYAKGASKSMDTAAAKGSAGHETFMKRSAGQALALDKTNPEHKRLKAKVGTSDANAKDAAYKKAIGEEAIDEKMDDTQKAAVRAVQNWRQKTGTAKPSISDTKRTIGFIKKNSVAKEEVEQVDEISKDLAKNYIKKATQDVDNTPEDDENATKKLNNRESGIRTASMKKNASKYVKVPATEETDPGFKEGHVPDHQPKLAPKDASTMSKVAAMMAKEREAMKWQKHALSPTAKLVAANKSGKDS